MTFKEAEVYFDKLTPAEAHRFNLLAEIGLKLGKPIEGAYQYAHTRMEGEKEADKVKKEEKENE